MTEKKSIWDRFHLGARSADATLQPLSRDTESFIGNLDQEALRAFEVYVWKTSSSDGDPVGARCDVLLKSLANWQDSRTDTVTGPYLGHHQTRKDSWKYGSDKGSRRYLSQLRQVVHEEEWTAETATSVWPVCDRFVKLWIKNYANLAHARDGAETFKPELELKLFLDFFKQLANKDLPLAQELMVLTAVTFVKSARKIGFESRSFQSVSVYLRSGSFFDQLWQLGEISHEQRFRKPKKEKARTTAGLVKELLVKTKRLDGRDVRAFLDKLSPAEETRLVQWLVTDQTLTADEGGQQLALDNVASKVALTSWLREDAARYNALNSNGRHTLAGARDRLLPASLFEQFCYHLVHSESPIPVNHLTKMVKLLSEVIQVNEGPQQQTALYFLVDELLPLLFKNTLERYGETPTESSLSAQEQQELTEFFDALEQANGQIAHVYSDHFQRMVENQSSSNLKDRIAAARELMATHGYPLPRSNTAQRMSGDPPHPSATLSGPPREVALPHGLTLSEDDLTDEQWLKLHHSTATRTTSEQPTSDDTTNTTLAELRAYLDSLPEVAPVEDLAGIRLEQPDQNEVDESEDTSAPVETEYITLTFQYLELLELLESKDILNAEMVQLLETVFSPVNISLTGDQVLYTPYLPESLDAPINGRGKLELGKAGIASHLEAVRTALAEFNVNLPEPALMDLVTKYVLSHEVVHAFENAALLQMQQQQRSELKTGVVAGSDDAKQVLFSLWSRKADRLLEIAPLPVETPEAIAKVMSVERAATGMQYVVLRYLLQQAGVSVEAADEVTQSIQDKNLTVFLEYLSQEKQVDEQGSMERALRRFAQTVDHSEPEQVATDYVPLGYLYPLTEPQLRQFLYNLAKKV